MNKIEYVRETLAEWGLTTAVPIVRPATQTESIAGTKARYQWLRDRVGDADLGKHPSLKPWHFMEAHSHVVYGFRDPAVAFEFKMRFG